MCQMQLDVHQPERVFNKQASFTANGANQRLVFPLFLSPVIAIIVVTVMNKKPSCCWDGAKSIYVEIKAIEGVRSQA